MITNKTRLLVLSGVALVALVALIAADHLGLASESRGIVKGILYSVSGLLLDALGIERRRRDPSIPAVPDDIRAEPAAPGAS